ncbi:H/ACA ribonucleoprotein complex subunit gar1 [Euphorbia peplus]|nr:H/ACA ribonucleoprotein complex subunit gar1 [Euphorbia peplus]
MRPPRGGGFRGRGDGGRRGGGGGRGFGGGRRGGFGGGGGGYRDEGPPSEVVEISTFLHACEGDAVTKLTNEKIPYFNAPIFLQNKTQIGKVDEIFGPINESYFSIKMMEGFFRNQRGQQQEVPFVDEVEVPLAEASADEEEVPLAVVSAEEVELREVVVVLVGAEEGIRSSGQGR